MKKYCYILFLTLFISCDKVVTKNTEPVSKSEIKTVKKDEQFTDVFTFISFNNTGDKHLLNTQKDNKPFYFVDNRSKEKDLLRGDLVQISWKKDTIYDERDNAKTEIVNKLLAVKKIEDGIVSKFRKNYGKEISYNYSGDFNYSQEYLNELYLMVEYYIASCEIPLVTAIVSHKDKIEYSVEQQQKNGKEYTVIGIGTVDEGRITNAQWLFYDAENKILYEYNLPNDELVVFDL